MTSTSHANERGSAKQRRRRRALLVERDGWPDEEAPELSIVLCWLCWVPLLADEFTVDRVTPGVVGGTYALSNCRPACARCNHQRGGLLGVERLRAGFPCPV